MGWKAYRATGIGITAMRKALGLRLRVTGVEHLVDQPTLFVANHFTRLETFLIPYVLFQSARRQVRSLGMHTLFSGVFGRYFQALGAMSVRDPKRNRTIIRDLMTGRHDWLIYPEGGLIKNKKTTQNGRLHLEHPSRHGPPHTGAAVIALKAAMGKRRYVDACARNDERRRQYYEDAYGVKGAADICSQPIVITPMTITFHPMRPGENLLTRLARLFQRNLEPRLEEELQFEGRILLSRGEVSVHFGEPIEVRQYLGPATELARRLVGIFSEQRRSDLFLRRQARRLTDAFMHAIYQHTEINFDHLFCYGLRSLQKDHVPVADVRRALFVAASELVDSSDLRLHPVLQNGISALVTGERFEPLERALDLARSQGIIRLQDGTMTIDRHALEQQHDFHEVRLRNMVQVIANEVEPVKPATNALRQVVNRSTTELKKRVSGMIHQRARQSFRQDYESWFTPGVSREAAIGEPFLMESGDRGVGVVLLHGYLACPEEMRPLARSLNERGCTVYAVRLPGHGTAPEQLTEVSWRAWMEEAVRGHTLVSELCEKVFVGGLSLGGILALLLAARTGDRTAGVFSINAPLSLRDPRVRLISALVGWNDTLRKLRLKRGYSRLANDDSESPDINYPVMYLSGVRELRRAVRACRDSLSSVRAPSLIVQSDHDPLVSPDSAERLFKRIASQVKFRTDLDSVRHIVIRGQDSQAVFRAVEQFIDRIRRLPGLPEEATGGPSPTAV